jgi:hypothetical protein
VPNATDYQWTVPPGSVITGGAGTPSIQVQIGDQGGQVSLRAVTACSERAPVYFDFAIEDCVEEPPACQIHVFPNPTSGIIHLKFTAAANGHYKITLTRALTGLSVFSSSGCYDAGLNEVCLDLSCLPDGEYILHVKTAEFDHSKKIEIKH